tara:strand:- start:5 stop:655 length:651 start_codon:yes stop_codon:yes gene_type:complete
MILNEDVALEWWYEFGRDKHAKDQFLACRTSWEELQRAILKENGDHPTHDETKDLIRKLDKSGMLGHDTLEEAIEAKRISRDNLREWNVSKGVEGLAGMVSKMHDATSRTMPDSYLQYINSGTWKRRAARYLNERATHDGLWVCEICGTGHPIVNSGRTIQVHHNTYSALHGDEHDSHLMAVCDDLCHQMADVLRRIKSGSVDIESLNDMMRPLFS